MSPLYSFSREAPFCEKPVEQANIGKKVRSRHSLIDSFSLSAFFGNIEFRSSRKHGMVEPYSMAYSVPCGKTMAESSLNEVRTLLGSLDYSRSHLVLSD